MTDVKYKRRLKNVAQLLTRHVEGYFKTYQISEALIRERNEEYNKYRSKIDDAAYELKRLLDQRETVDKNISSIYSDIRRIKEALGPEATTEFVPVYVA